MAGDHRVVAGGHIGDAGEPETREIAADRREARRRGGQRVLKPGILVEEAAGETAADTLEPGRRGA